jgi:hypothetical protein
LTKYKDIVAVTKKALSTKASDPTYDLDDENHHLSLPHLLPTISAMPSPTAIWAIDTMLTGEDLNNVIVMRKSIAV